MITDVFSVLGLSFDDINVDRDTSAILEQYDMLQKDNSIAKLYPELIKEWDYELNGDISPEYVNYGSVRKCWWKCLECGNRWLMTPNARTNQKQDCPNCSPIKKSKSLIKHHVLSKGSLADNYPDIVAKEWDYDNNVMAPTDVSSGSTKKAWWHCSKCDGSYEAPIYTKTKLKPMGCPYCSGRKVLEGYNDFKTIHPEKLVDWDYEKNNEIGLYPHMVTYGSTKKAFWKCSTCNYEWITTISDRSGGHGCVACARKTLAKKQAKKVKNLDNGKVFISVKDAAEWAKIAPSTLTGHLKGKCDTAGKYHWKYL